MRGDSKSGQTRLGSESDERVLAANSWPTPAKSSSLSSLHLRPIPPLLLLLAAAMDSPFNSRSHGTPSILLSIFTFNSFLSSSCWTSLCSFCSLLASSLLLTCLTALPGFLLRLFSNPSIFIFWIWVYRLCCDWFVFHDVFQKEKVNF